MAAEIYLADTSAHVVSKKDADVKQRFERLFLHGRVAYCHMAAMEILNGAPDPQLYEATRRELLSSRWLDVTTQAMDRALEVHHELASRSQHRRFRLHDLIIAATAELNGATVLHYDHDYDRIAEITGQPTEWVAARGTL